MNNFSRPLLRHHYKMISLSELCLGVEKNILNPKAFSLYDLYDHYLVILVDPFLIIIAIF